MEYLKLDISEHVAYVKMQRGKANTLNLEMVCELKEILVRLQQNETIGGMVLYGQEGFFSAGLDLVTLYDYDEHQIRTFWESFLDLLKTFVSFPKPTIAAISGHSPAGGCVLTLCCDYRIMAKGDFIIGMNEVPVGIIVPHNIFVLYSFWLGKAKAYRFLLAGELLDPERALHEGLVDELAPMNQLHHLADKQMKKYLNFNWTTWQRSKQYMRKDLIATFHQDVDEIINDVLQQWWNPSTRAILKTIITNLQEQHQ
ncbi:enoyl-CoA hydratase/isomerase family protein [Olivibacter ginsenosidimutans]|uniref:Enoyl-CoA hydratase/isomerase family protein n=1 Tax=Olivibacter ginsenosidimutans TaxID=1176537 RepID=A0ABP9AME2_9SPHI